MDSGASRFILSPANFHSLCYSGINEESAIDLGLSLRTMPPQPPHQPDSQLLAGSYEVCQHVNRFSQMKSLMIESSRQDKTVKNDNDEEEAGTWGRERWTYVKVNMDGVIVGRKICILDHGGYSSLALQLEDMFGSKSVSGLRLLQAESEFSLFYKDNIKENWRTIGDVSWNEFVKSVKRLRITLRD